jgi:hypothetical protein
LLDPLDGSQDAAIFVLVALHRKATLQIARSPRSSQ